MKKLLAIILLLTGILGCDRSIPNQPSCYFQENGGQRVSWKYDLPVTLYLDSSVPQSMIPAIQAAVDTWNQTGVIMQGQKFFILQQGNVGSSVPAEDGWSKIYYTTTNWPGSPAFEAYTTLSFYGNRITEADININGQGCQFGSDGTLNYVDTQSVMLHELGHVLGLIHPPNAIALNADSIMYYALGYGQLRREISAFDISNISCQY